MTPNRSSNWPARLSREGPGRTRLALVFPRHPPIIPYGGFSPITVGSAAFYREPFRLAAFDSRSAASPQTHLMSRRYYPLAGSSPYGRRSLVSRRRPQALGSTWLVMSGSAIAEAPVSGTPARFVSRLIPAGLCPRGRFQSPSLLCLVTLSTPATTLTPPVTLTSAEGCSISVGSLRPSGGDSAAGFCHRADQNRPLVGTSKPASLRRRFTTGFWFGSRDV